MMKTCLLDDKSYGLYYLTFYMVPLNNTSCQPCDDKNNIFKALEEQSVKVVLIN